MLCQAWFRRKEICHARLGFDEKKYVMPGMVLTERNSIQSLARVKRFPLFDRKEGYYG